MVRIERVTSRRSLKEFILFPHSIYGNNANWIPDLVFDELSNLNAGKNPAFAFCKAEMFLAYRGECCVGRIAVFINHQANKIWKQNRARFSRADFVDDDQVVDALFDAAEDCAKQWGCAEIHGPLGLTDFDKEGSLIEGFDQQGTFLTYYNEPYYQRQFERKGFIRDTDWVEYLIRMPQEPIEKIAKLADLVQRRSGVQLYRIRSRKDLMQKISELLDLVNQTYANLYGVTPINEAQKKYYVKQFIPLIHRDYLVILQKDDQICALGWALPSVAKAVRKSSGRLLPLGLFRLLLAIKKNDRLDLALIAVRPDMQKAGLPAILMNEMTKSCLKHGIKFVESNPELENNADVQALWKYYDSTLHKRRRCYVKSLV